MTDKYSEERAIPKIPMCGKAPFELRFDGYSLRIIGATGTNGNLIFSAVSGRPNENKGFDYSVERQKIPRQGPIPVGEYWIQPSQIWENSPVRSTRNPYVAWGHYRVTIHPYPSTETYGRGGFFIHGGTISGSAGCIDLTVSIVQFIEQLDKLLGGRPKCYIPLHVRY
ncbi:MAG: DUF2778 domain-containing protein [Azoarcus sp.]|jgi:hypothetical protein|nr:DUF2778 domain-containing protein [Azoarcus sp.]